MKAPKTKRRYLKTRQAYWAQSLAKSLAEKGVLPNQVSIISVLFAALAGTFLLMTNAINDITIKGIYYVMAALFIQMRLLCNLLDGLLAVECGLKTKSGEIFNDFPDRLSDSFILVCAGYSVFIPILGWAAALLALFTAYIRVLGVSLNTNAFFNGPMAKPHRMFTLTVGCLLALMGTSFKMDQSMISAALVVIILGSIVTSFRRMNFIMKEVSDQ